MFVPEEKRTLYHAGLAHGANHLVTLVAQAMDLLSASGAEDPAATLRPLLTAALDNALAYGDAALTGPIVRGDVDTVARAPGRHRRPRTRHARVVRRAGPGHRQPRGRSTAGCCRSGAPSSSACWTRAEAAAVVTGDREMTS